MWGKLFLTYLGYTTLLAKSDIDVRILDYKSHNPPFWEFHLSVADLQIPTMAHLEKRPS